MADTNKVPPTASLALTSEAPTAGQTKSIVLVEFDAVHLVRGADFSGNSDEDFIIFSFWIDWKSQNGELKTIYVAEGILNISFIQLFRRSDGEYEVTADDTSNAKVIGLVSNGGPYDTTKGIHHVLIQLDARDKTNSFIFIDDVDRTATRSGNEEDPFNTTNDQHRIGGTFLSTFSNFCIGDLFIHFTDTLSPTPGAPALNINDVAHRRHFISSDLRPIEMGVTGSRPYDTTPIAFFNLTLNSWHLNQGDGGGMTKTDDLTDCGSHPPVNNEFFPTAATLSLSSSTPTVLATDNHVIIPPKGDLTLSSATPEVVLGVIPPSVNLTLSSAAPTVFISDNTFITTPKGDLNLSSVAPGVLTPLNPPTASLSLSSLAPVVFNGVIITILQKADDILELSSDVFASEK